MKCFAASFFVGLVVTGAPSVSRAQALPQQCLADHYKVIALPLRPSSINDSGEVAGTTESRKPALWNFAAGVREIELPPGFITATNVSLNGHGHISGLLLNKDSTRRTAFYYGDHKLTLLLPEQSKAFALNDEDTIAGESATNGEVAMSPVLWRKQKIVDLGACCGGSATAVNNHGQAIGSYYDQAGHYHAFLWDEKNGIQSIMPQIEYSSAVAVNSNGHVLIQAFSAAYLFADGKLAKIDLSPKFTNQPRALNDCDVVVGSFGTNADHLTAFTWDRQRGFRDLNERIATNSGWKLEVAISINNRGEIVGWGDHGGLDDAGFLLVPER